MTYDFTITGMTPLLMHADNVEWADVLDGWRKDTKNRNVTKRGDDRSPAWAWLGNLYHDGQNITLPVENIQKCLSQAGARIIMQGKKTFKEYAVSGLWIEPAAPVLLVGGKPVSFEPLDKLEGTTDFTEHLAVVRKMGFDLFMKRVRIGQSKNIRIRPKFDRWSVVGTVEATEKELTRDVIDQIFTQAGKVGLGDWRPGCPTPGRFGMFHHTLKPSKGK